MHGNAAQSPADVMEYSAVSEVLEADYEAAGTCSEDLYVHAFNPVCSPSPSARKYQVHILCA